MNISHIKHTIIKKTTHRKYIILRTKKHKHTRVNITPIRTLQLFRANSNIKYTIIKTNRIHEEQYNPKN